MSILSLETILADVDAYIGKSVTIAGTFMTVQRNRRKVSYITSASDIPEDEQQQLFIDHSPDELQVIIDPLPRLLLIYHGTLTNPPYLHRFQITLTGTLHRDAKTEDLSLGNISHVQMTVPYSGKVAEHTLRDNYVYSATVDYTPTTPPHADKMARATVHTQKILQLRDDDITFDNIEEESNRYARRIAGEGVQFSGWLQMIPSNDNLQKHFVVMTPAIRASMVAVGPLREPTAIWIRPSEDYSILRSHITRPLDGHGTIYQAMTVLGKVDYVGDTDTPFGAESAPKLVFTAIHRIILKNERYLY